MLLGIRCGTSLEPNPLLPLRLPTSLKAAMGPRPTALPLSPQRPFQPSSSRSILRLFSRSSRNSRSDRRTRSCASESLCWSSSMLARRRSILSRALLTSSLSWEFALSRRSIWDWRSLTVRSTLRKDRCSVFCLVSSASRWVSSWCNHVSKLVIDNRQRVVVKCLPL